MNIFTLPIDKFTGVIRTKRFQKPGGLYFGILSGLVILLALYTLVKAGSIYTAFIPFLGWVI
jgi:hypothetical protein